MKKLTKKERLFCRGFAMTGDGVSAARMAGYTDPQDSYITLLAREDIAEEIRRTAKASRELMRSVAVSGLWRLAFGDISDAVSLCFERQEAYRRIGELDLYNVAEIKSHDKGIEIKFFDRIKALDKLCEILHSEGEGHSPTGLIEALAEGARSLRREHQDGV